MPVKSPILQACEIELTLPDMLRCKREEQNLIMKRDYPSGFGQFSLQLYDFNILLFNFLQ